MTLTNFIGNQDDGDEVPNKGCYETIKKAPFLTGSRVYGTPREDSDIDLVMFMEEPVKDQFLLLLGNPTGPVYVGNVNLILCTTTAQYDAWWDVTEELKEMKPVTREYAKQAFQDYFDRKHIDRTFKNASGAACKFSGKKAP